MREKTITMAKNRAASFFVFFIVFASFKIMYLFNGKSR